MVTITTGGQYHQQQHQNNGYYGGREGGNGGGRGGVGVGRGWLSSGAAAGGRGGINNTPTQVSRQLSDQPIRNIRKYQGICYRSGNNQEIRD